MTDAAPVIDASKLVQRGWRRGTRGQQLILLVLGVMIGAVATHFLTSSRGEPAVVQGTVSGVAADPATGKVLAIAFRFDGRDYVGPGEGTGIPVVADVPWTDAAGQRHGGTRPSCLTPGRYGQRVELGVLDVRGEGAWYSQLVVWVHCLS